VTSGGAGADPRCIPDDAVAAGPGEPAAPEHLRLVPAQHLPARDPCLGTRHLDQLTAIDIEVFYAALLKNGRKTKSPGDKGGAKGLSPKSVHNIHVMLNKALSDAARKGTVIRNVVALADLRRSRLASDRRSRRGEIDQLVRFLDAISGHGP